MIIQVKRSEPTFTMVFDQSEGWIIVGALNLWVKTHPNAMRIEDTQAWADDLDKELRR